MSRTAPLLLGSPVRFQDRWRGRVAGIEVDDGWNVLNISITAGLFRPATVRLPVAGARWDEEHLAFPEIASGPAFKRQVPPVAAASRPIGVATPVSIPGARPAGAVVDVSSKKAEELLFTRAWGMFRLSTDQVSFQGLEMRMTAQTETLAPYLSERGLRDVARGALGSTRPLTAEERRAVAVTVNEHCVLLSGNVLTPRSRQTVVQAVAHAVSPVQVSESITDDLTLEFAVGQALLRRGVRPDASLYPRSRLGVVTLYGEAPLGVAAEAERVTSRVPGVRSVNNRIEISAVS